MKNMMVCLAAFSAAVAFGGNFEVPERWQLKKIAGEKLLSGRVADSRFSEMMKRAKLRCYDKTMYIFSSPVPCGLSANPASVKSAKKPWSKPTYAIEEVLQPFATNAIALYEKEFPGRPYFIHLPPWDFRDPFYMPRQQADVADFARWRKEHPCFAGFSGLCEIDGLCRSYFRNWGGSGVNDPEVNRRYPKSPRWHERHAAIETMCKEKAAGQFGCADRYDINSVDCTFVHLSAKLGAAFLFYEADHYATAAPWQFGAVFARGASRQWNRPWGWHVASYAPNYDRNGKKHGEYDIHVKSRASNCPVPFTGSSRSLNARGFAYGYFAGTGVLTAENYGDYFARDAADDRTLWPSEYCLDYNVFFELDATMDRGVPYTPLACLCSIEEPFQRQGHCLDNYDLFSQPAFFFTLCPTRAKKHPDHADFLKGEEGCLFNSEFGELCDAIVPDAGQADFYETLRCYPVATLIGWFDKTRLDTPALVRYVKEGGRLYVTKKQVADGLVPAAIEGKGELIVLEDPVPADFIDAPGDFWDDKLKKVIAGERTFPVYQKLLRDVQEKYMPVKVEGDIQWGVNRIESKSRVEVEERNGSVHSSTSTSNFDSSHWLVWLINNKGVTKFALEDQVIDRRYDAKVKVTDKATGKVYTKTVPAGGYSWIEI